MRFQFYIISKYYSIARMINVNALTRTARYSLGDSKKNSRKLITIIIYFKYEMNYNINYNVLWPMVDIYSTTHRMLFCI